MSHTFLRGQSISKFMKQLALFDVHLPIVIRIAGAMNNDPKQIYPYFQHALQSLDGGILMSGGTTCIGKDGQPQASVAEVVNMVGKIRPGIKTIGTFPQVAHTVEHSNGTIEVFDNTFVNTETELVIMIESGKPDTYLEWDGDVDHYIDFMTGLRDIEGFYPAVIVWSGGGVTVTEAKKAHSAGIPVIVVDGSGRACNDQLSEEKFSGEGIYHVPCDNPEILRLLLLELGLSR